MDTSDPGIGFDAEGRCTHCHTYLSEMSSELVDPAARQAELERRIAIIKRDGKGRPYDCIAGVSGGVDSTYVLLLGKRFGLRTLAVHLDNGWDSEIAVSNIQKALEKVGVELLTKVLDWDEFRDLQVAFLKASTPDSEIPTDHAIVATVYLTAWRMRVRHLLMGYNKATELVLPPSWSQGHYDWRYINAVQKQFGTRPLRDYPHLTFPSYLRFQYWTKRKALNILNYVEYSREQAIEELQKECGWRDYGGKHHESLYTRFFQSYILPRKFGFDKRRAHLSNMVLAGRVTREQALAEIATPAYASKDVEREDRAYVIKKLGLTDSEFEAIMSAPPRRYQDYPTMHKMLAYRAARRVYKAAQPLVSRLRATA